MALQNTEDAGQSAYSFHSSQQIFVVVEWVYAQGAEDNQDLEGNGGGFCIRNSLIHNGHHEWQHPFAEEKAVDDRSSSIKAYLNNNLFAT